MRIAWILQGTEAKHKRSPQNPKKSPLPIIIKPALKIKTQSSSKTNLEDVVQGN